MKKKIVLKERTFFPVVTDLTCIRLPGDVELALQQCREHGVELLQGLEQVPADARLVGAERGLVRVVAESGADWLVKVEDVRLRGPRCVPPDELGVAVDGEGAVLDEQAEERGSAGAALQPDNGRGALVAVLREVKRH